jgi:hypothetical protein
MPRKRNLRSEGFTPGEKGPSGPARFCWPSKGCTPLNSHAKFQPPGNLNAHPRRTTVVTFFFDWPVTSRIGGLPTRQIVTSPGRQYTNPLHLPATNPSIPRSKNATSRSVRAVSGQWAQWCSRERAPRFTARSRSGTGAPAVACRNYAPGGLRFDCRPEGLRNAVRGSPLADSRRTYKSA